MNLTEGEIRMKTLQELYNVKNPRFVMNIVKLIESYKLKDLVNIDIYGEHRYALFVDEISPYGSYQTKEIAEFFGMETLLKSFSIVEDESINVDSKKYKDANNRVDFAWENICRHDQDVANQLNNVVSIPGYDGSFYFGHLEADGSYGLFYMWTNKDQDRRCVVYNISEDLSDKNQA